MAHKETDILNRWMIKWNRWGIFFRAQVGRLYGGTPIKEWVQDGVKYITLKNAYPMSVGVKGQPDYQGWHTMVIKPEHVGMRIARYTVIEGKSEDGVTSKEQAHFMQRVRDAGGYAFVVRSPDTPPPAD